MSLKAYLKIFFRANEKVRFYIRYRVEKERMDKNETKKEGRKKGRKESLTSLPGLKSIDGWR